MGLKIVWVVEIKLGCGTKFLRTNCLVIIHYFLCKHIQKCSSAVSLKKKFFLPKNTLFGVLEHHNEYRIVLLSETM